MEKPHQFDSVGPSLLMLSDDTLLELFKYLDQNDALSLAGTCRRLQQLPYRNFYSMEICPTLSDIDDLYITNLFAIVGPHIRNLTLKFDETRRQQQHERLESKLEHLSSLISKNCNRLESLIIYNLQVHKKRFCSRERFVDLINVKSLYFKNCNLTYGNNLFRILRKIESVDVQNDLCTTSDIDFGTFFRKNMDIKLFVWNSTVLNTFEHNMKMFVALPKLEKLCIKIENITKSSSLNPLTHLATLKHLELTDMNGININKFLDRLAMRPKLEKAIFGKIKANEETVLILQKFPILTDLTLHCSTKLVFQLNSNTVWPQNLQSLRLNEADVTFDGCMSVIQRLCSLKTFYLFTCCTNRGSKIFDDTMQLQHKILEAMDLANNSGKLEVTLDLSFDFFKIDGHDSMVT